MRMRLPFRRLRDDRSGTTLVEFGFVLPVMVMLWMGLGDLLYQMYAQSVLTGAVQAAGRSSGIQGNATSGSQIDSDVVVRMVGSVVDHLASSCSTNPSQPAWCSTREAYDTYSEVAPEPFTDGNSNGVHDAKECFTDVNGNGSWDSDPGVSGQGGASDVVVYTMTVRYPRLFPVTAILGFGSIATIKAQTLLKNQPYATQSTNTNKTICP